MFNILHKNDEKILYQSPKYTLIACDEMEEFSNIRTLVFKSEDKEIPIGSFETFIVAGEHEWCIYNEDFVAILHENRQTGLEPTIKTLFDTNNQDFIVGTTEYCNNYLQKLMKKM